MSKLVPWVVVIGGLGALYWFWPNLTDQIRLLSIVGELAFVFGYVCGRNDSK